MAASIINLLSFIISAADLIFYKRLTIKLYQLC